MTIVKNRGRVIGSSPYGGCSSPVDRRSFGALGGLNTDLVSAGGPYDDAGRLRRDALVAPAEARHVTYQCPTGHALILPFHTSAAVPQVWECKVHRQDAPLVGRELLEGAGAIIAGILDASLRHNPKTHMERVRERRTEAELEAILAERLGVLRAARRAAGHR